MLFSQRSHNNGTRLAKGKEEKLKKLETQIKELEKLAESSDKQKELTTKIVKIRSELPL